MDDRNKCHKPANHEQDNALNALRIGSTNLHVHDAPNHKDDTEKSRKENKPMKNPVENIRGWLLHLGEPPNSNRVVAIFTVIIALTGIIYAVFAALQWCVLRDTLALERPWLGPTKRAVSVDKISHRIQGLEWYFSNGGKSTATEVRIQLDFVIGPVPTRPTNPKDLPYDEVCNKGPLSAGHNIVLPGFDTFTGVGFAPEVGAKLEDMYAGKAALYFGGCVDYSDAARKACYRTNVTEYFRPQDNGFVVTEFGNDAF